MGGEGGRGGSLREMKRAGKKLKEKLQKKRRAGEFINSQEKNIGKRNTDAV